MIDYIIQNKTNYNNPKELVWRLCNCYEDSNLNYKKVVDLFIDLKDSYYISELVTSTAGNLDQKYLTNKMIETNDIDFIKKQCQVLGME